MGGSWAFHFYLQNATQQLMAIKSVGTNRACGWVLVTFDYCKMNPSLEEDPYPQPFLLQVYSSRQAQECQSYLDFYPHSLANMSMISEGAAASA